MGSRIVYIDIAKGLAILLVIIGHIDTVGVLKSAIYSFHMPLFFILSGFFVNIYTSVSASLKKMLRTLIVPYLVVGGGISILKVLIYNANFLCELRTLFLVMWKYDDVTVSIGPIWFLTTLFLGKLWLLVVSRSRYMYTFVVIGALLSLLFTRLTHIVLPFTLLQALSCTPFLLIGMKLREHNVFEIGVDRQLLLVMSISCMIFSPLMSVAMRVNSLTPFSYFSSTIISVLLIYYLIEFESLRNKCVSFVVNFLSWCGRYSILILSLHSIDDELHLYSLSHSYWVVEIILRCSITVLLTWLMIKIKPVREFFCV